MSKASFMYWGILLISIIKLHGVVCDVFTGEQGPFEIILQNTSTCTVEQPWFHTNVTVFTSKGKTLLRGTVDSEREIKDVKFNIALYYKENNKDVKVFDISDANCHNVVVRLVLVTIGIPYNAKLARRCTMKPIHLKFNNLNIDTVVHTVGQSTWYGDVRIRWEIFLIKPQMKLMCLNIELSIVKPRDKKIKSQ